MSWLDKKSYAAGVLSGAAIVLGILFVIKILLPLLFALAVLAVIYFVWWRRGNKTST